MKLELQRLIFRCLVVRLGFPWSCNAVDFHFGWNVSEGTSKEKKSEHEVKHIFDNNHFNIDLNLISRPLSDNVPKMMKSNHDIFSEESQPLKANLPENGQLGGSMLEIPTFKQFPAAMKRLFTNKLLMCNVISGIFYILGASAYMTFMSKYLEVQFHKSAADAMIITGPFTIIGVCVGFLGKYIASF